MEHVGPHSARPYPAIASCGIAPLSFTGSCAVPACAVSLVDKPYARVCCECQCRSCVAEAYILALEQPGGLACAMCKKKVRSWTIFLPNGEQCPFEVPGSVDAGVTDVTHATTEEATDLERARLSFQEYYRKELGALDIWEDLAAGVLQGSIAPGTIEGDRLACLARNVSVRADRLQSMLGSQCFCAC